MKKKAVEGSYVTHHAVYCCCPLRLWQTSRDTLRRARGLGANGRGGTGSPRALLLPVLRRNGQALQPQASSEVLVPLVQRAMSKYRVRRFCSANTQSRARETDVWGYKCGSKASAFGKGQGIVKVPAGLGPGRGVRVKVFAFLRP